MRVAAAGSAWSSAAEPMPRSSVQGLHSEQLKWVEAMAARAGHSPVRQWLRALDKLP
jgi:hypothetical protein